MAPFTRTRSGAIGSGLSETRTARLAVGALLAHKVTGAFADVVVTDSEGALGRSRRASATWTRRRARTRPCCGDILSLLGDAEGVLADARIAGRRGDEVGLRAAEAGLQKVGDKLERAQGQLG